MKVVFFGLSITSSWGNGHATTYRSLLKALIDRGHSVCFVERDRSWYRDNRDLQRADGIRIVIYDEWEDQARRLLAECRDADAIVIGSYFPDAIRVTTALIDQDCGPILFYDIDTPVTLSQLRKCGETEYLTASLIPHYDAYLSFSGGPILGEIESRFGSRWAVPFYCSVDPERYSRTLDEPLFRCDLSYLGTYAADRQAMLTKFLDAPARTLPEHSFIVAGPLYPEDVQWASNVRRLEHVAPPQHSAFYSSSRFTLNLTREDMVAAGYSPSVRLFEAAACGATLLSDRWPGIEAFLTPGEEVLLPSDGAEIVRILTGMSDAERLRIGARARDRVLAEHTSAKRAEQFEVIVSHCRQRHPASATGLPVGTT